MGGQIRQRWAHSVLAGGVLLNACARSELELFPSAFEQPAAAGAPGRGGWNDSGGGHAGGNIASVAGQGGSATAPGSGGRDSPDACAPNPCLHEGVCTSNGADFECECPAAFAGDRCTLPRFEAVVVPPPCTFDGISTFTISEMSGDGQVLIGGCSIAGDVTHGFSSSRENGFQLLEPAGSWPVNTNRDGSVSVGSSNGTPGTFESYAISWRAPSLRAELLTMAVSHARGVSGDGNVVVGDVGGVAVRFSADLGAESLGTLLDGGTSQAVAANEDGSVVVGSADVPGQQQAFYWTRADGMRSIDTRPAGSGSYAYRVSADGSVVMGIYASPSMFRSGSGFRWTRETGMVDLGGLPGTDGCVPADMNRDGSVIIGSSLGTSGSPDQGRGFIWDTDHGMRELLPTMLAAGADLAGWTLDRPIAVSDDGKTIAGWGYNPSLANGTLSWVVRLP